jgi:hypothetical protein
MGRPVPEHAARHGPSDDHRADHHGGDLLPAVHPVQLAASGYADHHGSAFASIGGIIGLFVSGEYLSVPASVGFIALWGIAVLNGVVLVSYIRKLREEGLDVREAARQGATMRFAR